MHVFDAFQARQIGPNHDVIANAICGSFFVFLGTTGIRYRYEVGRWAATQQLTVSTFGLLCGQAAVCLANRRIDILRKRTKPVHEQKHEAHYCQHATVALETTMLGG